METKKTNLEDSSKQRKLNEILNELNNIEQYCMDQNLTLDEMKVIFEPLKDLISVKTVFSRKLFVSCLFALIFGLIVAAYNFECVSWFFMVILRLFLIGILPIFDWTPFARNQCILIKPEIIPETNLTNPLNCDVCESLYNVTILSDSQLNLIERRYFSIYEPFILPFETMIDGSNFSQNLFDDAYLMSSVPCDLGTNLFKTKKVSVEMLYEHANNGIFQNWFVHFRNCDTQSIKYVRYLLQSLNTFKSMYRTNSNWILFSQKYLTESFKILDIEYGNLIIFTQIQGGNFIELTPINECSICHTLKLYLPEQNSLIFISNLWKLSYKPDPNSLNSLAIIEEMFWDD
ncbi:uncharacterized protein LOC123301254 [Chrysoperla carnea]|uniref:uncharacterized protein LOC123301254 n=1 Tax=Chrysoperla carnea TaxID=189513 RepID=UPI001D071F8C|nr:uncharacterized protein LOC123301254 [Chrysoperla carnea]